MGIFGSDYESAGVGIPKNAPKKKGVFRFFELLFRKFWKLIQVNMLYSVFFIPILLAGYAFLRVSNSKIAAIIIIICLCAFAAVFGPATAGMMKILRNYTLERHSFILTDFKEAFSKNYKKSFVLGLLDLIIAVSIGSAVYVYPKLSEAYGNQLLMIPFIISISIALVVIMMNYYAFLMIVATDISFKNIIKNSLALACVALKKNLITLLSTSVIIAIFIILILINLNFILFLPFVPASILAFIICFNSYPIIQKYVINPFYKQRGEINPELIISENDNEVLFEDKGGKEKPIEKKKKSKKGKIIS